MSGKSKHLHHIYCLTHIPELTRYDSVCDCSDAGNEPVLTDEAGKNAAALFSKAEENTEYLKYVSGRSDEADDSTLTADDLKTSGSSEETLSGFDRFYYEHQNRHSGLYFTLGLIIILIILLGVVSSVYLLLSGVK